MLMQRPGEAAGDFANRKQLWSIGIATVFLVGINNLCDGDCKKRWTIYRGIRLRRCVANSH